MSNSDKLYGTRQRTSQEKKCHCPTINIIIEMPTMDILSIDKGPRKKKKEVIVQLYYYH